ncbi:cytochrome P450 [Erythrobacter sp. HKB08]|uniref:cytochrome P450 n=1 Tax=Erythrobacter sp. HKB08 TaxID=2502843 RepID=UPI0010087AB8|nr:cytochrome P450 [Erythrobacter sp. HKB08]
MATAAKEGRAIAPVDVSREALYVEDSWREPFKLLRREMPVSYCPESPYGPYWSVVTHDLVSAVELDHETFSSSWKNGNITITDPPPESNLPNFIASDPPVHTAQRKVIQPAFAPSQMKMRELQVRERCSYLLDKLPLGETFDWVSQVSIPQTMGMLCILFGMDPDEEAADLKRWSDYAGGVSESSNTDEFRAEWMVQMQAMLARFDELLEERRQAPPTDDLLSRMVHSDAMGNLTPMERLANIALLIVGGNDTTRNSISGLVEALDTYPDQLDALHGDAALIPNAAQEIIRWQSPVLHMRRTTTRDTELGGQHIPAGEKVVMWYISANRDESVFPDAEKFDVARSNARRHLAFGHGIHRCVGARLAEIQIATIIEEIVARGWRIVPQGKPTRLASPFLRAFTEMPVKLEKRG